jgi:RNA-binding protein
MDTKQIKELKAKAKTLDPILRIGKNGITDTLILEIKKQLKKNHLIKIKILKSAREQENIDKKAFVNDVAQRTESELIELIGYVFVLYKKN